MTTVITEGRRTAEFLISEANGHRSRDQGVVAQHSQTFTSGTVLGRVTVTAKLTRLSPGASNGTQTAAAVLYADVDATGGDRRAVVIARDAEVNGKLLSWPDGISSGDKTTAIAALAATGIIVRA
jgi:hypothetical protein